MTLEPKKLADEIGRVAVLDEPLRRALYLHVAAQGVEVSRDQAARALCVSRNLAAFHLDKLVEGGLLQVEYRRLSGRRGPGAGRPAKLYRRSREQVDLTLPKRRYELAAQLLLRAIEELPADRVRAAVRGAAFEWGRRLGVEARSRAAPEVGSERLLEEAIEVLGQFGFEPRRNAQGNLTLRNCPFEALKVEHRDLVCGMNLALMEGLLEGLQMDRSRARLDPQPGLCCVMLCAERRGD